jgi:Glyoxalase-like domain
MELDHIFVLTTQPDIDIEKLKAMDITETYRREHIGQGTSNACFAFENAFLELLWITDQQQARSPQIARTGLFERSQWQTHQTCPFGVAWRNHDLAIPMWEFKPPYLPPSLSIQVANDSDDLTQPMMFTFPGSLPPSSWSADKHKNFQYAGGYTKIEGIELTLPNGIKPSPALQDIAQRMSPQLKLSKSISYGLRIQIGKSNGEAFALNLPGVR